MPTSTNEQTWTPPVHDTATDQADLALYDTLHSLTGALVRPVIRARLTRLTAESASRLLTDDVRLLHDFLSADAELSNEEGEPAPPAVLQQLDAPTLAELTASLTDHLQTSGHLSEPDSRLDDALADDLAAEFARSLWSTLLDHAMLACPTGLVDIRHLIPDWRHPAQLSEIHRQLMADLTHFGLPLETIVDISQQTMRDLILGDTTQDALRLPMGLQLSKHEARIFLGAQESKKPRQVSGHGLSPQSMLTEQLAAMATEQLAAF